MIAAPSPLPVVILISGRGSNLQSIIDAVAQQRLAVDIRAVISNRPAAAGLHYSPALNAFSRRLSYWQASCAY